MASSSSSYSSTRTSSQTLQRQACTKRTSQQAGREAVPHCHRQSSTSAITFSEVMQKLADDMDVDKLSLFQRWWDTAHGAGDPIRTPPRLRIRNLFCNSAQQINGFPYRCPRAEGCQAILNPFDGANPCAGYTAIAFVNRFDLADKERGRHCGEFRIVFARNSGFGLRNCQLGTDRILIIFEALVPNPEPPVSPVNPPRQYLC